MKEKLKAFWQRQQANFEPLKTKARTFFSKYHTPIFYAVCWGTITLLNAARKDYGGAFVTASAGFIIVVGAITNSVLHDLIEQQKDLIDTLVDFSNSQRKLLQQRGFTFENQPTTH